MAAQRGGLHVPHRNITVTDEDQVKRAENDFVDAMVRGNADKLGRVMADECTVVDKWGDTRTKTQLVSAFATGESKVSAWRVSNLNVRLYKTAAVVTGEVAEEGTDRGRDLNGHSRFTHVLIKRKGHWLLVSGQETSWGSGQSQAQVANQADLLPKN